MDEPTNDNLALFRDPACTCNWWELGKSYGVQVSEVCAVHGRGTSYWAGMTDEMKRIGLSSHG